MALGFTQEQVDALVKAYAKGQIRGSVSIEGRSFSWDYGSLDELLKAIQTMTADIAGGSTSSKKRSTFATYNRGA